MNKTSMKKLEKLKEQKNKMATQLSEVSSKEQELTEALLSDLGREFMNALETDDILVAFKYIEENISNNQG